MSLTLKTSKPTNKQAPKPEPSKIVKKDDPKPKIDLDDEQEETNLIEIKKGEKKQPTIQQTSNEGWQPSDEPKDLPTDGIGKKPNVSLKKYDEPVLEIRNEEFPDIAAVVEQPKQSKKQKNLQFDQKQEQKHVTPANNGSNGGLFTNSNSKPQTQISNVQNKNPSLNNNSGPLTFTNTKKQENTAFFQQQQQESIKKIQQEQPLQQSLNQETQKPNLPPQRQVNFSRNSNVVAPQPIPEQSKQLKVEESIPTFINSKAKLNPPVVQQEQQQQQQQQHQEQEQENQDQDSDGWEIVEKKGKSKGQFQRNQKQN